MSKYIVTTTINYPTKAIFKYISFIDWNVIIVGDLKTPHDEYIDLQKTNANVFYLTPEYQEQNYKQLSDSIGWNKIPRRNIGYIEALKRGAQIIASVDDDNIPLDNWGKTIYIGTPTDVYYYETDEIAFDPICVTNYPNLWHRGFPIQELYLRKSKYKITRKNIIPDIQADFWNGDPDIDAMCRFEHKPNCFFDDKYFPFSANTYSPFNSQNTFFSREALKKYLVFPGIGRMDDIWSSYYMQSIGFKIIYNKATVFQDRNVQDLTKNLTNEFVGYEKTKQMLIDMAIDRNSYSKYLPDESLKVIKIYNDITSTFI